MRHLLAGVGTVVPEVYALQIPMLYRSFEEADYVREKMTPRLDAAFDAQGFVVLNRNGRRWSFVETKLIASDGQADDIFGVELGISGDGQTLVVSSRKDDDGGIDSGSVYVFSLVPDNAPPEAVAGPDQSIRAGDTVNLDGSGSFDDNTASASLIYSWSFSTLPGGSSAVLSGASTATPSFVADVEDTYVVQLVVLDEGGLFSVANEVTISSDNMAPTADATVDFSLAIVGDPVNFDGTGSTDPEMDPLTYSWSITMAPAGSTAMLVDAGTANPTLTPDLEGVYEVTLDVADFLGFGTPAVIEVTATTASEFAENLILEASDQAAALGNGQVTTKGNQNAFGNFLAQAISKIQSGDIAGAIDKLEKAIARTDGCALNGSPDGNGSGRDWITDCDAQLAIYDLLTMAVDTLEN